MIQISRREVEQMTKHLMVNLQYYLGDDDYETGRLQLIILSSNKSYVKKTFPAMELWTDGLVISCTLEVDSEQDSFVTIIWHTCLKYGQWKCYEKENDEKVPPLHRKISAIVITI